MRNLRKYKVAAVQAGPVYLNLQASVDKACGFIKEAAENGAKLIGFPEAYLPGYPWFIFMDDPLSVNKYYEKLFNNALEIGGPEFRQLSKCAKDNKIFVCISGSEKEGSSLYLTQFWFDDNGNFIGKHRKMRPTFAERTIWGGGDGSMLQVYDTKLGKIGGLECSEHIVPLYTAALAGQGIEIHVAAWPPLPKESVGIMGYEVNFVATRYQAISNQAFTLFCTQVMNQDVLDMLCNGDPELVAKLPSTVPGTDGIGGGVSCIFDPVGRVISNEINHREEGIVYGDVDLDLIISGKRLIDPAGHYAKPNCMYLNINTKAQNPVEFIGEQEDYFMSFDEIQLPEEK